MCNKLKQVFVIFTVFTVTRANVIPSKDEPKSCKDIDYVARSKWGARVPIQIQYQVAPLQYVVIHHSVTPTCSTEAGCSELLKNMQNFHMDELEYYDIGYNFLVGGDGKIYEGVGFHKVGAHTRGYNTRSLGLTFIGNFQGEHGNQGQVTTNDNDIIQILSLFNIDACHTLPPQKQLQAAKDFLQCAEDLGEIDSRYKLIAGRQVSATQSPGLRLYHELQNWSHFTRTP